MHVARRAALIGVRSGISLLVLVAFVAAPVAATVPAPPGSAAPRPMRTGLAAGPAARAMDSLLSASFRPDEPGAAVIVVRGGELLLRKGYGMADLERRLPVDPGMVFRIGSVTKQFTSTAILMLAEEGKLRLDDPITKFLPNYPTHGQTITVEHLLTHTSGIKSYTEMSEWLGLWRKDMPLDSLIALFKDQPAVFAPGEKWAYDNSGYVLLGAVIEKASGRPYADFVRDRIFVPLGMTRTRYDTTESIVPDRVPGYQQDVGGWRNAAYLSMTQPYAAGSLISTVDDLAKWDAALYTERLVKRASLERAWTPSKLNDGTPTGYGYGWNISVVQGHSSLEHEGGINGFLCSTLRLPEDHVYVAVLTNREAPQPPTDRLAVQLAAIAIGKPIVEPRPVALSRAQLDALVGVYRVDDKQQRLITRTADTLFFQRSGSVKRALSARSPTEFYFKGSFNSLTFVVDSTGRVAAMKAHLRYGPVEVATKTDEPLPAERKAIRLDRAIYDRYVGKYELGASLFVTVTREGEHFMAQVTGDEKEEIFAESETRFFLKTVDAQLEFERDANGRATGLVLHQGGQHLKAKRVD
jgi:CubicO group peptidase (beta-lactamase class C family)